tara:strand:- start:928 stop:1968 length:1041 start_codon:yes stop_codon:yes gene_type:complete
MKIFVTGGCGFIGSNFILERISNKKDIILNYDLLTYAGNLDNLSEIANQSEYIHIKGDICDSEMVSDSIFNFKPDCIVHFAAESHVDRSIEIPSKFVNTNILGTSNLLNASTAYWKNNKNFIFLHVSTDEVYGSLGKTGLFSEKSHYLPSSPYSASKASSDHLVRAWNKTYGLPVIVTNCSNNYGPYQFPEKLIPLMIANCLDEKPLPVYGKGDNIRDWLYVKDHCRAIDFALEKGLSGETYCVGGNNEIKNIDIVNRICTILDELRPRNNNLSYKKLIKNVPDRPGHDFRYAIDSSKIKENLNWVAEETFESGILKTITWYLDNEKWWRKIQKNTYKQERIGLDL